MGSTLIVYAVLHWLQMIRIDAERGTAKMVKL
jgi:hypothetical protein